MPGCLACISKAKALSSPSSPTTAGSPTTASDSSETQLDKDPLVEDVLENQVLGERGLVIHIDIKWCFRVGCLHAGKFKNRKMMEQRRRHDDGY